MSIGSLPRGVDTSNWQGDVTWPAVAADGNVFAITKSSEGVTYIDPTFARDWAGIKAAGMLRAAYHFAQPDLNSPEDEAAYFVSVVQGQGIEPGDMLALDLEAGTGYLGDWALRFLQRVETLVGFKPLLYSSPGFIVDHGLNRVAELGQYGLWIASWGLSHVPAAPLPWEVVAFWQYADDGTVPGISGPVDLDAFNGPVESIRLYGKPETVTNHVTDSVTVASGPFAGLTLPQLQEKAEGLLSAVSYLGDNGADALTALAKEAQRIRVEQVGVRP